MLSIAFSASSGSCSLELLNQRASWEPPNLWPVGEVLVAQGLLKCTCGPKWEGLGEARAFHLWGLCPLQPLRVRTAQQCIQLVLGRLCWNRTAAFYRKTCPHPVLKAYRFCGLPPTPKEPAFDFINLCCLSGFDFISFCSYLYLISFLCSYALELCNLFPSWCSCLQLKIGHGGSIYSTKMSKY